VSFLCLQGEKFQSNIEIFGNGFTTPLEFGINLVYVAFLVAESFYGYKVIFRG
jgi:hypothetical protein